MSAVRLGILLGVVLFSSLSSAELKTLTFVGKSGKVTSPVGIFLRSVLEKSYAELGYEIDYIPVPLGRSLIETNYGRLDGLLARTASIAKEYPNLVKVPFDLLHYKILLVTNPKICNQCTLDELPRVATVKGFKAFEVYLAERDLKLNLREVATGRQLLGMLSAERVEGVVIPYHDLFNNHLTDDWAVQVLGTYATYHFLHIKHVNLVPRLHEQFKTLQSRGDMSTMMNQALQRQ